MRGLVRSRLGFFQSDLLVEGLLSLLDHLLLLAYKLVELPFRVFKRGRIIATAQAMALHITLRYLDAHLAQPLYYQLMIKILTYCCSWVYHHLLLLLYPWFLPPLYCFLFLNFWRSFLQLFFFNYPLLNLQLLWWFPRNLPLLVMFFRNLLYINKLRSLSHILVHLARYQRRR